VQRLFDGDDRAIDARAVAAGGGQQHGALGLARSEHARRTEVGAHGDQAYGRRRHGLKSATMPPLETSAQSPAPVRQIANLVWGYIDRLGAVWVEGQIAQINRRPGLQTVFMTLRDAVADISIPLTVPRDRVDSLATPLVEGASVVILAKPAY